MSIVTITLGDRKFELACPPESHSNLVTLAEKLDLELGAVQEGNPTASFELQLVITALSLVADKQSEAKESGGQVLENANKDFQKILSSVSSELKVVARKLEKC